MSLVLLACIHATIFLPAASILTLEALVAINLVPMGQTDFAILVECGYIFFHFTAISKILNSVIYYKRVPFFKQALRNFCGKTSKEAQ